jgi:hypothetical protein
MPVGPPPSTPHPPARHTQTHPSNAPHAAAPPVQLRVSAPQAGGQSAVASTGVNYPVAPTVGAGVAAIGLGAGALTAAHALKNRQESSADT